MKNSSNTDNDYNKDWSNIYPSLKDPIERVAPITLGSIASFREAFNFSVSKVLKEQEKMTAFKKGLSEPKRKKRSKGMKESNEGYYRLFEDTNNGEILINPKFEIKNGTLSISTQVGKFETYHAYNGLKNGFGDDRIDFNANTKYKVLSAGAIMYHKPSGSFYLFKRPENSQEAAGQIDLLGGCMNTEKGLVNGEILPTHYVKSRMDVKAGININPDDLKFLGVQEFNKRGFYNIVYLYNLSDKEKSELEGKGNLKEITPGYIDRYKGEDNPGGAALNLALEYLQRDNRD